MRNLRLRAHAIFTLVATIVFSSLVILATNASSPDTIIIDGEKYTVVKWMETCESTHPYDVKNVFLPDEDVYLKGYMWPHPEWLERDGYWRYSRDLYVFAERTWTYGEDLSALPEFQFKTTINIDVFVYPGAGRLRFPAVVIDPQLIWEHHLEVGSYDVVLDLDSDGSYDPDIDLTDDLDVNYAGFLVISEVPFGTATALLTALASLLWKGKRKLLRRVHRQSSTE